MTRTWMYFGLFGVLCALGMMVGPAAADGRRSIKDAPVAAGYSWQGFYVGGHAGLVNGSAETNSAFISSETDLAGALYGVQAGYNWQRGAMVLGIEGSWSGTNVDGSNVCSSIIICTREVDWVATMVGRAGWAMNHTLLYGFGGVAWGNVNAIGSFVGGGPSISGEETHTGWTAGFGLEHALNERVSFKIEYAHVDLGSSTHSLTGGFGPVQAKIDATLDTVRLGVNFKLTH